MTSKLPPITIFGAGLSGLSLGLSLRQKNIPAVLYDRATAPPRHNYGISLHASTYLPLLKFLDMDEVTFRERVAVNSHQGGIGSVSGTTPSPQADVFRCHRGRLEALLSDGLSINWGKRLKEIHLASESSPLTVVFDDGTKLDTACLVGCEGPHSITRQSLSPSKLEVLPYVVFNGERQVPVDEYMEIVHQHMKDSILVHKHVSSDTLFEVSVNDFTKSHVNLSYVYSRPARGGTDPLHRPQRPVSGATDIPEELFDELDELIDLEPPFKNIFDSEKVRDDRLLYWLMRCIEPDAGEARRLAKHGIVLIGDAVHATPIIGGDGANMAIRDGLDLAEFISSNGVNRFEDFSESKIEGWKKLVAWSKERIEEMHTPKTSQL